MRAFSSLYLPNGTSEQIKWFADMQRISTSGETAARLRGACDDIDIFDLLPRVKFPPLSSARQDTCSVRAGRQIAMPGVKPADSGEVLFFPSRTWNADALPLWFVPAFDFARFHHYRRISSGSAGGYMRRNFSVVA